MNTPQQIHTVLSACRTKPKFPAQVDVEGWDPYNPVHQGNKQGLFAELHSGGLLQSVRDPSGRRTPLGYLITPKGQAELKLLSKHPALAKK
jgi:hypothetical protein